MQTAILITAFLAGALFMLAMIVGVTISSLAAFITAAVCVIALVGLTQI